MSAWWTYQPSDFLMFSPRVYYRLFELHNESLWPLQLLMVLLGLAILFMLLRRARIADRFIYIILGAIWIWVGWSFIWERYATINWPLIYVAPFFALEALLLIAVGLLGRGIRMPRRYTVFDAATLGLLLFSLIGYPFVAPMMGRGWLAAEIFGIVPDPTAVATLAILSSSRGGIPAMAMVIPAAWCLITGATLWVMEAPGFFIAPLCAFVAVTRRFV